LDHGAEKPGPGQFFSKNLSLFQNRPFIAVMPRIRPAGMPAVVDPCDFAKQKLKAEKRRDALPNGAGRDAGCR
jgi:hypothetical protein